MRRALALRVALWAALSLQGLLLLARLPLEVRLVGSSAPPDGGMGAVVVGIIALAAFPVVGAVIVRRLPRHPVGWLFCVGNLGWILNAAVASYVRLGVVAEPGSVPAPETVAWLYTWPGFFSSACYVLLFLRFPDGRFLSRRWRQLGRATVASMLLVGLLAALAPGRLDSSIGVDVDNPFGLGGAVVGPILNDASTAGFPLAILLLLAAGVSAVQRFRRSSGVQRLQLKWFSSGLAAWSLLLSVYLPIAFRFPDWDFPLWAQAVEAGAHLGAAIFPVTAAIAVLRYRLYEIDRIISRTVTYALVTLVLGGVYVTGVVVLGGALQVAMPGGGGDLVVAASTLAVAAAFGPLRRRVQALVDRRFARARYDARRTVEAFAQRLRDQVDLTALSAELRSVVGATVAPVAVGLWLRSEERP